MIPVLYDNCLVLFQVQKTIYQVVIHAESTIIDYSIQEIGYEENEPKWLLYCVDETGKVFSVTSQQFEEQLRVSSNSKDTIDILSDLLEPDHDDDVEFIDSTVPVFRLTDKQLLYKVNGKPKSLCSYGEVIIILSFHENAHVFTALKVAFSDSKIVVKEETKRMDVCHRKKYKDFGPHIGKIITCSMLNNEEASKSSDIVNIDNNLFKSLFGTNQLLLNVPVYLFCPPDGNVYVVSLNSFFLASIGELTLFERKPVESIKWKMLCETTSGVVNILTMEVPYREQAEDTENIEADFHVLLVCCSNGNIITFHYDHKTTKEDFISQLNVRGPILASIKFQNRLYHSTSSNIYECSFEVVKRPHSLQRVELAGVRSRKQAQIYSMSVEKIDTFIEARDTPCILNCIQKDGQKRCLDSSVAFNKDSDDLSSIMHIKDVLLAIDKTDTQQQNITEVMINQEKHLEQISTASFLLNQYLSRFKTLKTYDDNSPITLKYEVEIDSSRNSQHQIELGCELTNQMPRNLSSDWSVEISAIPFNSSSCSKSSYPTAIVPLLEGFKVHETARVGILIPVDFVIGGFDLLVSLNLDMSEPDQDRQCLTINVFSKRLNIVHFMVSKQALANSLRCLKTVEETTYIIEDLAQQQPLSKCLIHDKAGHVKETSVTVTKSLQFTNMQYQQLTDDFGAGPICVLKYLLKDSLVKETDFQKQKCHIMTLTGHDLILEVKDITQAQIGEIKVINLIMQSDLSIISALLSAVALLLKDMKIQIGFHASIEELKLLDYKLQAIEADIQTLRGMKNITDTDLSKEIGKLYQRLRSVTNLTFSRF